MTQSTEPAPTPPQGAAPQSAPSQGASPQSPSATPSVRLDLFDNSEFDRGRSRLVEALWVITKCAFFLNPIPWPSGWRCLLLRIFGASIGKGLVIRPGVNVHFPWRLKVGDHCWIGDGTQLLSLYPITIEDHVALSHQVYIAAGGHDIRSVSMASKHGPVVVKTGTWIATRAFIGPGVTVHERVVVGAGTVLMKDVGPDVVVVGNPARVIGPRVIDRP
jgi:putative colanic acid biosynthesis acetyltransferase WcaF